MTRAYNGYWYGDGGGGPNSRALRKRYNLVALAERMGVRWEEGVSYGALGEEPGTMLVGRRWGWMEVWERVGRLHEIGPG